MRYLLNILIAIDQMMNALIGGAPDETLSASAYLGEREDKILAKIARPIIDFLFRPFEKEHCKKAFHAERLGLQLPEAYRDQQ